MSAINLISQLPSMTLLNYQTFETINGVTTAFGYDYDNQLVSITTGSNVVGYAYDALGRRVSRTTGGVTTVSLYDGGRVILEEQGGNFTGTYTYGVSLIRRNGEFFQYDGLGSARTFTNASGAVTAAATYDGFGNTVATSGSTSSPYQFGATSGYRNDGDAGIMQVGARYYDPATGSFLTRDTDLNQLAYVYCGDDPIDRLDPSGHEGINIPEIPTGGPGSIDGWIGVIPILLGSAEDYGAFLPYPLDIAVPIIGGIGMALYDGWVIYHSFPPDTIGNDIENIGNAIGKITSGDWYYQGIGKTLNVHPEDPDSWVWDMNNQKP